MSELQRLVVRMGNEADVPALKYGELGMDVDTIVMRIGDETPDPPRIMTTKSSGDFDFTSTGTIKFNNAEFEGSINGVDFASLSEDIGFVVSLGGGEFRETVFTSSDGSVIISNNTGQAGNVDFRVSTATIAGALSSIQNQITQLTEDVDAIGTDNDLADSVLKMSELTGRPLKATDLDTFLGNIIPDNATIKTALQSLENAIAAVDTSNFNLQFGVRDDQLWQLKLTDSDSVVFEGATHELTGLMTAEDKVKLDLFTVTDPINLDTLYTGQSINLEGNLQLNLSNGQSIPLFIASSNAPGLMSISDRSKLDGITVTTPFDLDRLQTRVTALENAGTVAGFFVDGNLRLFTSDEDTTEFAYVIADHASLTGLAVRFDRMTDGGEPHFYDAITCNGITLVEAENVTKSYSGAVIIFRGSNGYWYFLNKYGYGTWLATDVETTLTIEIGTTNSVQVNALTAATGTPTFNPNP